MYRDFLKRDVAALSLAIDIVCPLFDDLLGGPAATVVALPGGGPILFCLVLVIEVGLLVGR